MPETPVGYFPDVKVSFAPSLGSLFATEVEVDPHSGEEQRRARSVSTGQRVWRASTASQEQAVRRSLYEFLKAKRGQLHPFYFFAPDPSYVEDASLGSVTAATTIIVPWKGGAYTDVRVAGVTNAFTVRGLTPRENVYAALRFDGTNDYINAGSSGTLKIVGNHTYAAWIWVAALGSERVIVSNLNAPTSGTALRLSAAGALIYYSANGATVSGTMTGAAIPTGTWTHVAVVRSGGNVTFYVNGVARNTVAVAVQTVATNNFFIGQDGASALYWTGMLADVRVYQNTITAGEVLNLANSAPTADPNLKGHWKLDEGTGTTATDSSGAANTGTLVNSPTWVAGEDEITFTGGAQTGAVTGTLTGRQRVIARSLRDVIDQTFVSNVADVRAAFPVEIMELP